MSLLEAVLGFATVSGMIILCFGVVKLVYVPLGFYFNWRYRARPAKHKPTMLDGHPLVSVIVPGFNEAVVLDGCVESILASEYPNFEIILVDDGSEDDTAAIMARLAAEHAKVSFVSQENAGKGAALNRGIALAAGEILVFVDADGLFAPDTLTQMLLAFDDPKIGAVCGDDRPVNLDRIQTQMLSILSHVGTGLVRRALSLAHCLPIVSGNVGAFKREAVELAGGFHENSLGEDLELTWRLYRQGYRVKFQPKALVYAESPSTIAGLWRQRVRWSRGLLQTLRLHYRMVGNIKYGTFGMFLVYNTITMVVIPVLQLLVLVTLPYLYTAGYGPVQGDTVAVLGWLGLFISIALTVISVGLNRSWPDLRYLWTIPLWPFYSVFVGLALTTALGKEIAGSPARWNKLNRTGVVSVRALTGSGLAGSVLSGSEVSKA